MKHKCNFGMRSALWAMLAGCLVSLPPVAFGDWKGDMMCACPGMAKPLGNNATCEDACYGPRSSPRGGAPSPSYDYGAAQRAREAEAERQRQQVERDRIERERREEEKRLKEAAFARDRDAAAATLKGSGGAINQLKGLTGTDNSGLKGSGFDSGNTGLRELRGSDNAVQNAGSRSTPLPETSVVDARSVPSGLAKALKKAITNAYADAPPGVIDRVRKGFQAVMDRDWKVAKAWFEDALMRDPSNAGLKRLVVLADISQPFGKQFGKLEMRTAQGGVPSESEMKVSRAPANKARSTTATDPNLRLPDPGDIYLLFPGLKVIDDELKAKAMPVSKVLPDGRTLQLPKDSDIELLFDLYQEAPAKRSGKAK